MAAAPQIDHLLAALYSATAVLIEAVSDPVALEQAPLRHRASALHTVHSLITTLHKFAQSQQAASPGDVMQIHGDFGSPTTEDPAARAGHQREAANAVPPPAPRPVSTPPALPDGAYAAVPAPVAVSAASSGPRRQPDVAIPAPLSASPSAVPRRPENPPASDPRRGAVPAAVPAARVPVKA